MSKVKRPHMVAESYLRGWANRSNVVDVVDLQKGLGFKTSIRNATVVSYVYDPEVVAHDLEAEFSRIESAGAPAILKLRNDHTLSLTEKRELVSFLDMYLERNRYADQAEVFTPARIVKTDGSFEDREFALADRLVLSRYMGGLVRLSSLGLEDWPWTVATTKDLPTGDGGVLLFNGTADAPIKTITFPLSPTQVLQIGEPLPPNVKLNLLIVENSRRWVVGAAGSLQLDQARTITEMRRSRTSR